MIDRLGDPEAISLLLISSVYRVIGAAQVPLGMCREIQTETGRLVGWYIERVAIVVLEQGMLAGFLAVLPDGQRLSVPIVDIGVPPGVVQVGQVLTIDELRLVHPQARAIAVRSA